MDKGLQVVDEVIHAAAADMGLVAERRLTRADVEAMVAEANAQEWPEVLAHEDRLVAWDEETGIGTIERTVTFHPLPENIRVNTSVTL